jgi:hypothetical protein
MCERSVSLPAREYGAHGQRWAPGVQNVPHSAWVKTDVAFAVLLAASVFTHALRRTFSTPFCSFLHSVPASVFTHARYILYPLAVSVFIYALRGTFCTPLLFILYQRGFLPTRCEVHSVGVSPPTALQALAWRFQDAAPIFCARRKESASVRLKCALPTGRHGDLGSSEGSGYCWERWLGEG